jgi:hypothetical protein
VQGLPGSSGTSNVIQFSRGNFVQVTTPPQYTTVASYSLPAGKYVMIVTIEVDLNFPAGGDNPEAFCDLLYAGRRLVNIHVSADSQGAYAAGDLRNATLEGSVALGSTGTVILECTGYGAVHVTPVSGVAFIVDNVTQQ